MSEETLTDTHRSDIYSNFLIHWKYIKREKIVGAKKGEKQWRYFYKDEKEIDPETKLDSSENRDTVTKGKQAVTNIVRTNSNKTSTEVNSILSPRVAIIAGTILAKVSAKVIHETDEKIDEKLIEKRAEQSRAKAKEASISDDAFAKQFSDLQKDDPLPMLPVKTETFTHDEDMAAINPKYNGISTQLNSYTLNCAYCTAAYDLRLRGYDVEADSKAVQFDDPTTNSEIMSWYDGAELETLWGSIEEYDPKAYERGDIDAEGAAECLEKDLISHGEGARGHLLIDWAGGGGHDVIWEIENNEVVIRDCQTNDKLEVIDYLQYASNMYYFRTDNIQPNEKILETVRSRK